MRLYKINYLIISATLIKNGIFKKNRVTAEGEAVARFDYIVASNLEEAGQRISDDTLHYIHYGWTIDRLGGKTRLMRDSDTIDTGSPICATSMSLTDITDRPPEITDLKRNMDARDFLRYCAEYLPPMTTQNEVVK